MYYTLKYELETLLTVYIRSMLHVQYNKYVIESKTHLSYNNIILYIIKYFVNHQKCNMVG